MFISEEGYTIKNVQIWITVTNWADVTKWNSYWLQFNVFLGTRVMRLWMKRWERTRTSSSSLFPGNPFLWCGKMCFTFLLDTMCQTQGSSYTKISGSPCWDTAVQACLYLVSGSPVKWESEALSKSLRSEHPFQKPEFRGCPKGSQTGP